MGDITNQWASKPTHITRAQVLGISHQRLGLFPLSAGLSAAFSDSGAASVRRMMGGERFLGWRLVGIGETPVLNEGETYGKISLKRGRFH